MSPRFFLFSWQRVDEKIKLCDGTWKLCRTEMVLVVIQILRCYKSFIPQGIETYTGIKYKEHVSIILVFKCKEGKEYDMVPPLSTTAQPHAPNKFFIPIKTLRSEKSCALLLFQTINDACMRMVIELPLLVTCTAKLEVDRPKRFSSYFLFVIANCVSHAPSRIPEGVLVLRRNRTRRADPPRTSFNKKDKKKKTRNRNWHKEKRRRRNYKVRTRKTSKNFV